MKLKAKHIIIPVISISVSAYFIPWMILRLWISPVAETIQGQVNKATDFGMDGIIVYVDQPGKEPVFYTAGWKDRDQKIPADPQSLFKIASISKLYIAAATTKLVSAGKLSLDKTLADYLPDFASHIENSDQITLRMLVQHRSGIPNYTDHPDYPWTSPFKENDETYRLVFDQPAAFNPDQKYKYSNTNYLLIGEILDRTLGYRHHQYIREEILEPLGLKNTFSLLKDADRESVMSGYSVGYPLDIKSNDFVQPGGSMVATAQDVGIFLGALIDGTLFTPEQQAIYTSLYPYEHTGLLPGYQSIAKYHPELDAVVIQFVNTSGGEMWTLSEMIYNRVIRIMKRESEAD